MVAPFSLPTSAWITLVLAIPLVAYQSLLHAHQIRYNVLTNHAQTVGVNALLLMVAQLLNHTNAPIIHVLPLQEIAHQPSNVQDILPIYVLMDNVSEINLFAELFNLAPLQVHSDAPI